MYKLGSIPTLGDNFELEDFCFEIMDMDENRVDKVLLTPLNKKSA